ncbi:MAG: DUF2892 domain-containing protein [Acholeplasmatales bacterium]|nr:MAG: DUF2892 domain-containing protein [Acholeplasmatales bacterium]
MQKNVGSLDQTIRYVVAILLVMLAVFLPVAWSWVFLVPAAILAFTAATGWCGLYRLFGIKTCPIEKK